MNLNGLRTAASFLTRVPINAPNPVLAAAAPWFPVVGVAIGVAQGAALVAARQILQPLPAAVLAVAAAALITGAFHHDGLADMADAFGGGWDVEQRLTIMKDSRLGTYGTSALILAFATEISVLASIDSNQGFRAVVAAHTLSRAIAVAVMFRAPIAEAGSDGMGASYAAELSPLAVAAAVLVGLAVTAVVFTEAWAIAAAVALAIVAALTVVALAIRKIGGVTGDVLGAVQQLASLAVLLVAASSA